MGDSGAGLRGQVICVGSCNMDLLATVPRLPAPGETVHGDSFSTGFGGKGANQAVAAARLGAEVHFVGKVGADAFGEQTRSNFEAQGIDTAHLRVESGMPTGVAPIWVDSKGQNSIVVVAGANSALTAREVEESLGAVPAPSRAGGRRVMVVQNEVSLEATVAALRWARAHGVVTVVNPAPASRAHAEATAPLADVLCPNETEAEVIGGVAVADGASAERACAALRARGAAGSIVITAGATGAFVSPGDGGAAGAAGDGGGMVCVPAPPVSAVDTVGAGDCFCGTLAARLAHGDGLAAAVGAAIAVASVSVQRPGTQSSYPRAGELPAAAREAALGPARGPSA